MARLANACNVRASSHITAEELAGCSSQAEASTAPSRTDGPVRATSLARTVSLPVPVDGVPDAVIDGWFAQADANRDGRVADAEARNFFLRTGLSVADLSRIWKLVKSPEVIAREGKGLSRHRFAQVLRLIALAQSGLPFNEENAKAALDPQAWRTLHAVPLPPPRLLSPAAVQQQEEAPILVTASPAAARPLVGNPFAMPEVQALQPSAAGTLNDLLGLGSSAVPSAPPPSLPRDALLGVTLSGSMEQPAAADDDDLFGLAALHERRGSGAQASSSEAQLVQARGLGSLRRLSRIHGSNRDRMQERSAMAPPGPGMLGEPPLAFEARLPPLQPKLSAKLTMLAAGNGSLFAGPANNGSVLQWAQPEGYLQPPLDLEGQEGMQRVRGACDGHCCLLLLCCYSLPSIGCCFPAAGAHIPWTSCAEQEQAGAQPIASGRTRTQRTIRRGQRGPRLGALP